jgi:hypothetical protein
VCHIAIAPHQNPDGLTKLYRRSEIQDILGNSIREEGSLTLEWLRNPAHCLRRSRRRRDGRKSTTLGLERRENTITWIRAAWKRCLLYSGRSGTRTWQWPGARRRKEFHDVEHKLMKVPCNELINFIKDQETHFRAQKAAGRSKKCVKFLWSTTDDVWHILME